MSESKSDVTDSQTPFKSQGKPSLAISLGILLVTISLMAYLRLYVFRDQFIALAYGLPLLICLWHRDRGLLWAMATAFIAMATLKAFWMVPAPNSNSPHALLHWGMQAINIVVIAGVVHAVLNLMDRVRARQAELEAANEELAAREKEISQQNEELQTQSEELARQNEELQQTSGELEQQTEEAQSQSEALQAANAELERREKVLEVLLSARDILSGEKEILGRLCVEAVKLLGPDVAGAAVMEAREDMLHVHAHAGVKTEGESLLRWPLQRSFARLVMQENRPASLNDLSLRRDLVFPQSVSDPPFRSILAAPLLVGGKPIGAVEFYAKESRPWTEDQFRLAQWVAARCSSLLEKMRLRGELQAQAQKLQYHIQNTPLGVIEFDANLRVSVWSDGAQRIFGWEASEVLGRPMWEIPWICEEDRGKVEKVSAGLESGQTPRSVSPNRNLRKDGTVIWCEWYNSSLTGSTGKMQSILSLVLDVTEREQIKADLERLVAERTARLTEMISELQQVSYAIVHDMRAPLRAMSGFARALTEDLDSKQVGEEAMEYCRRIQVGATRLDKLITDALTYTKAVVQEVPMVPVSLSPLVHGIVETYPNLNPDKADIRVEGELPTVVGNESLLTQCFSNLLGNAVKFVAPGVRPCVRVRAEEGGTGARFVRVWVEDNGIGIPLRAQKRLFGMFQKLDSQYEGTGIGLAIVRKVVERMSGTVGAESEPGKGSRFWVELPRAEPGPQSFARA